MLGDAEFSAKRRVNFAGVSRVEERARVHCISVENERGYFSGILEFANLTPTDIIIKLEKGDLISLYHIDAGNDQPLTYVFLNNIPLGYHTLKIVDIDFKEICIFLFVHPEKCYLPSVEEPEAALTIQLYAIKSDKNWGIGSYTDLGEMLKKASASYSYLGVNPLHALSCADPEAASPYAPDSRLLFNEIYIDVEAAAQLCCSDHLFSRIAEVKNSAQVQQLRKQKYVHYKDVYEIKLRYLEKIFRSLMDRKNFSRISGRFSNYIGKINRIVKKAVIMRARQRNWGSTGECAEQYLFEFFLQWLCDEQIREAQKGNSCKLYLDLAIGCQYNGTDHLITGDVFDPNKSLGAPPDQFCIDGQKWNVAPLRISKLRQTGYEYFIEILRRNMMIDGALRIDHIIGFSRRFTMHIDEDASTGVFEDMPLDEFLAILAIESHRQRCIVIGEDLGIVPDGLRSEMHRRHVLGCVVFLLTPDIGAEEDLGTDRETDRRRRSLFSFGTHDCIPLCGYFSGYDMVLNEKMKRKKEVNFAHELNKRMSLRKAMFTDHSLDPNLQCDRIIALNRLTEKAGGRINAISLDDILGEIEPVNLPGTDADYPNWRRKYAGEFI